MPSVSFEDVRKRFGDSTVVEDFDLVVGDGELLVLVGGSGSGKSTVLRMVASLEEVTSGTIRIDERDVTPLPPRERDVAMVFQDYGLYPHMCARIFRWDSVSGKSRARRSIGVSRGHAGSRAAARSQAEAAIRRTAPAGGDGSRDGARAKGVSVR
jgi:ABC-type branched-subunit amino acid transport system ATPase component